MKSQAIFNELSQNGFCKKALCVLGKNGKNP
jgi:hypothetical protein